MKRFLFAVLLGGSFVGGSCQGPKYKSIGVDEFTKYVRDDDKVTVLDVRTPQEYREGHIPGSKNVPLQTLDKVRLVVENKDTELFVYCYSGARSRQATVMLQHMGYTNVQNIGGIAAYQGKVER